MARILHRLRREERGQALVEMALVLPLLLLLLFGVVEFSRVGHAYLTLSHAAREGARLGITGAEDTEIEQRIAAAGVSLNQDELQITLSPAAHLREYGGEFQVTLDYQVPLFLPLLDTVVPNPLPLQGRVTMRIE